jgi:molybdopterin converting factor small subunit
LDQHRETALRQELELLADTGVTIQELDARLKRQRLSREDYDELWLYAWSLLERRASRTVIGQNADSYGYGEVEGG